MSTQEISGHRHGYQPNPTKFIFGPSRRIANTPVPTCSCCGVQIDPKQTCYTLSANMEVMTCTEVYG